MRTYVSFLSQYLRVKLVMLLESVEGLVHRRRPSQNNQSGRTKNVSTTVQTPSYSNALIYD